MLTPEQIEARLERILLKVQKPGRYVGGELNSVVKDWDKIETRIALVFPDIYDIGISNLGLQILYDLVNQRPDALAERAYAPWVDMEEQMRANAIPLYSLETKHALADFDILGFSLPYETLYTNALNMLDLAGIPLRVRRARPVGPAGHCRGARLFQPGADARLHRCLCHRRGRGSHPGNHRCSAKVPTGAQCSHAGMTAARSWPRSPVCMCRASTM